MNHQSGENQDNEQEQE